MKMKTDTNKAGGIKVGLGVAGKYVFHTPTGYIDPVFNKVLQSYGVGWSMKQLNETSHLSGGHAQMRAVADLTQADCAQRILTSILTSEDVGCEW